MTIRSPSLLHVLRTIRRWGGTMEMQRAAVFNHLHYSAMRGLFSVQLPFHWYQLVYGL